jgi:hypothetical protein
LYQPGPSSITEEDTSAAASASDDEASLQVPLLQSQHPPNGQHSNAIGIPHLQQQQQCCPSPSRHFTTSLSKAPRSETGAEPACHCTAAALTGAAAAAATINSAAAEDAAAQFQRKLAVAYTLSWVVNILLLVAKLYAYYLSMSKAVLASAADSAVDLVRGVCCWECVLLLLLLLGVCVAAAAAAAGGSEWAAAAVSC